MCKTRLYTKIHPRLSRGCKVRVRRGVIIDPVADAGPGETRRRKSGKPKERKSGATRKFTPLAQPEDAGSGATRNLIEGGQEERCFGATRRITLGAAEGCEIWGNPKIHRRHSPNCIRRGDPQFHTGLYGTMHGSSNLRDHHDWRRQGLRFLASSFVRVTASHALRCPNKSSSPDPSKKYMLQQISCPRIQ
jgi:hypothetical protein